MIKFKNVKKDPRILKKIKGVYTEAFPKEERLPFMILSHLAKKDKSDLFGIFDETKFVGMLYTVIYKDIAYVFFFAIDKDYRNNGYGTMALKKIKNKYKNYKIALAIELVDEKYSDYEIRLKRKGFYENEGFEDSGVKICEYGVNYNLMSCNGKITYGEFCDTMRNLLGDFSYQVFYRIKKI